jgi:hypothetical protein
MAFIHADIPFHPGEMRMHELMHVPAQENPTAALLTQQATFMLMRAPLLALGTLDTDGRPWTTVWGGESGFSQPLGPNIIGTKTIVDRKFDPVVETLLGGDRADGEVVKEQGSGRMVGGLTIDLETRRRVKIYGRMMAGAVAALNEGDAERNEKGDGVGEVQLVVRVEQSLGELCQEL